MTILVHVGVRPEYPITYNGQRRDSFKGSYREELPDGTIKIWTKRMIISGCNREVDGKVIDGLIYCPHCDEYFSESQFKENDNE